MTTPASLDRARTLIASARDAYAGNVSARTQLAECAARLEQPLRVALAGSLKAGKSTLLNAFVGQDIAPTDATECTRVVTWYRSGATPTVTAVHDGDRSVNVAVQRRAGRLTFDLGDLTADRVDRLDVEWPAPALAQTTIIDTPGTSSLSKDVSARTFEMLTPENAVSGADAVVYLLRSLGASDVQFLGRIGTHVGGESGPLGVIGVVSRADEVGAGRADAMMSAKDMAARFASELELTGLCQAVVPVAGLLALGARTLRQSEFAAFEALATVPAEDLQLAMLSADRFAREDVPLPVDTAVRRQLVERFGLFGIRLAVMLIRLGVQDSPTLASELVARSGLDELRQVIDVQFGQRADQLKTHSALVALERVLEAHPGSETPRLLGEVRRLLADVHGFQELRMLGRLRGTETGLSPDDLVELQRLMGGFGIDVAQRLGLTPDTSIEEGRAVALGAVRRWRERAAHPLVDQFTARACRVAARSAEGVLADLGGSGGSDGFEGAMRLDLDTGSVRVTTVPRGER
ncbi:Isoniazid-inducible protein iniC [Prescottella agglutinans]|uniref:Isoniazid-inducible protein iniC n=1 Tax=Prescottella agglutinans TaxID=1644129 RepID=A0A438BEB8_9NOCA|nr:dynamin family protein [Prescottella agglutinans]RVW09302.1 Isoniazid-inducible protein iniC [Prescottella agglutinans]